MAQTAAQALPSRLFMSPFDTQMVEEEEIKPDLSSWGSSFTSVLPKFTPSDWLNPSPDTTASDYFSAPLWAQNLELDAQLNNPLKGSLAPSFWLFGSGENASASSGSSANGSSSSLPSTFGSTSGRTPSEFTFSAPGPSTYATSQLFARPNTIPTSLLVSPPQSGSPTLASVPVPSSSITIDSPEPYDDHEHKVHVISTRACGRGRAAKRRGSSYSSFEDHEDDHVDEDQYEIHEGVERDGMIWGMKVETYRALSARERKRVRNRISARTFRAKRKEHLNSLEIDLTTKDTKIKAAQDEAAKLRKQVADLKKRLAKYETV